MHLILATRGNIFDVNRMISELSGKYMPYKGYDGKDYNISLLIQPIQLWSMVFPKQNLQHILHTIPDGNFHKEQSSFLFKLLRKKMGAKPVPEMDNTTLGFPIYKQNIEIMHIGVIEDGQYDNEIEPTAERI
jgi:hypothetical protein